MQARIAKLQAISKERQPKLDEYDAMREEVIKRDDEKRRQDRIEQLLQALPSKFKKQSIDDFKENYPDQILIKNIVARYISTFPERLARGDGMIFIGKPGTGKTMLSLIIYQELVKLGFTVGYESSLHFLRRIREKEFESDTAFNNVINSYDRKSLLIIDEVSEGSGKMTFPAEWEKNLLLKLVNSRWEKNLSTIVISNRNIDELAERLGEPVVDRLLENGIVLAFNWQSYRKQGEVHAHSHEGS